MDFRGALLSDDTGIAIAVGVISAGFAAVMEYMAFRHRQRNQGMVVVPSKSSSTIALNSIE
jgi:hypothetical protein